MKSGILIGEKYFFPQIKCLSSLKCMFKKKKNKMYVQIIAVKKMGDHFPL